MTDRELEMKLRSAIENTAPDGLDRLLSDVDILKGDRPMKNEKRRSRWLGVVAACLAVALIAGFGGFWYGQNLAVATTVSLDVNPSIELKVNRAEKVISCTGLNDEGRDILSSMNGGKDLEGAKLSVAVNAIVGAIVKAGYLDSLTSAILISVEDRDAARGERLQAELVAEVDSVLQTAANSAGVLSQYMTFDAGLNQQAKNNNISSGKAAYINQVIALNPALEFDRLAELSVEELRDLIRIGAPAMPIGRTAAMLAASEYAGVTELDSVVPDVDAELDDPVPHYQVELTWGDRIREYEYMVDAFTGKVLSGQKDAVTAKAENAAAAITADEAFDKAAEYFHAKYPELGGCNIFDITTEYDRDGHYDVDFWCNGYEFEYEVDALTGEILREETRYRPESNPRPSTGTQTGTDTQTGTQTGTGTGTGTGTTGTDYTGTAQPADIGVEAAKAAALKHAGVSAGQVTYWEKTEKDYDNGRLEYEIDFSTADTEYDYEIDALTGAVIKYESEPIRAAGTGTGTGTQTGTGTGTGAPQPSDIGVEAAKEAALNKAGVAAGDATWLKCEHDWDDGHHHYELEFECGATVYECEVNAADGTILSFGSEACDNLSHHHEDDSHHEENHSSGTVQNTDIGADAATAAALAHAGLDESRVTRLKCERDYDDGRLVYEIEFKSNGYEYEYKIDAYTGGVLEHERDFDD